MNRIPHTIPGIRRFLRIALLAAAAALAPLGCLQGTESGTETGLQGLEGGLTRDGSKSAGAEVYAFRRAAAALSPASADSAVLLRVLQNPDTLKDSARFLATIADAEGRYRFTGLSEGDWSVLGIHADAGSQARWVGYEPAVKVRASEITSVGTISMRKLGGIRAVVAANGKPLEGAVCQVPGLSFVAYTDEDGQCALLNMPPGAYSVGFDHPGYLPVRRGPIVVESEIRRLGDTVHLVRDPAGAPPAPKGFSAAFDESSRIVTLSWEPSEVSDVAGYVLYRKPIEAIGTVAETLLRETIIPGTTWRDTLWKSIPDSREVTWIYRLVAMDSEGNASLGAVLSPLHIAPAADPVRLQFTQARYAARENERSAAAWVRRTGPLDRPVSLAWRLADSSALKDSDYVAMGSDLAFAPGDSLLPIYVLLTDDRHVEGPESFALLLSAPGNGAVLGALTRASMAVVDDDSLSRIVCPKAAYALGEKDSLILALSRDGEKGRRASFAWNALPAAGASGRDFQADSGTLAFDSGAVSLKLPLRTSDDTLEEKPERYLIRFSRPSRDVDLSGCPDIAVDIADDDSNYVAAAVDFTKAYTSHDAARPDVSRFPGGLYDGDTAKVGLADRRSSNAALLPKPTVHYDFKDCGAVILPDRSGNGMDARVGGPPDCRSDADGAWAHFDTRDTVILDTRPELDFQDGLTAVITVKPDSLAGRRTLVAKTYAPSSFALEIVDGLYYFYILIEDGTPQGYAYELTAPAAAGVWTHLAGTFDGKVMRLYVNGELASEQTVAGKLKITDRPVTIGNWPEWSAYAGGIREVKLFGQALNGWQIQEQMILGTYPPRPLSVTFDFAQPIWTQGAGASLSKALGTTRYAWKLSAADNLADLDGRKGSFAELAAVASSAPDAWSKAAYKARRFKTFRFTVTGLDGTGLVQINDLSLTGAQRVQLP